MLLHHHLTAAAFGLALTQAFLLIPEISEDAADAIKALPFDKVTITQGQSIDLACPGCPLTVADRHGNVKVKTDKNSHLELTFTIDEQAAADRLMLNGFELYPNSDPFNQVLTAVHKPDCKKGKKKGGMARLREAVEEAVEKSKGEVMDEIRSLENEKSPHRRDNKLQFQAEPLGFSLLVNPVIKSEDDNMELIALDLQIIEVANTFVDGIPSVHITLVRAPGGALMLGAVEVTESQTAHKAPLDGQSDCTTLLCKWSAMIEDMMATIKPFTFKHCGGKGKLNGAASKTEDGETPQQQQRPHHHHQHGGQSKPGHKHSWGQLFKNIVSHVLLPVLIGIIAGVSVSLIGMMVGTCIIALWRTFFRRHHRHVGHAHHKAVQKEAAAAEEKAGLMAEQESPPAYGEDADVKTPSV